MQLIGHRLCPFVQRVAILLAFQQRAHRRIDIDLEAKPDWLQRLSPDGTVPLLIVGNMTAIFETSAICDYLLATDGRSMDPPDPVMRARDRCWIEQASALLRLFARLIYHDASRTGFRHTSGHILHRLRRVEQVAQTRLDQNNKDLLLIDAAYASVLQFAGLFLPFGGGRPPLTKPLARWRDRIAAHPAVLAAVPRDYGDRMLDYAAAQSTYLAGEIKRQNNLSGR